MRSLSFGSRSFGGARTKTGRKGLRRWGILKRFAQARRGATAVEFAIVAAPFFATLYAIIQVSILYFAESMLETGVAEAARLIRTGQVQAASMDASAIRTVVCNHVYGILDCQNGLKVDVRSFPSFNDVAVPSALGDDGEIAPTTFDPGKGSEVVIFRVFYAHKLPIPDTITGISNMSDGRRLMAASAAFRNEPF